MVTPLRLVTPLPSASAAPAARRLLTPLPRTEPLYSITQDGQVELLISCEGLARNYHSKAGYRMVVDFVYVRSNPDGPHQVQPRFSKYKNTFDNDGHWTFVQVPLDPAASADDRAEIASFLVDIEAAARANPRVAAILERHPELKLF